MLVIAVAVLFTADPPALRAGQPAPNLDAVFADGRPYDPKDVKGKVVLITWWSADDESTRRHFATLRELHRELLDEKRLQMVSIKLGGAWEEWLEFQDRQPPLDPKHPLRRFYSDAKWWQAFHGPPTQARHNPFRVGRAPQSFLLGPDGKLLAVNVPDAKLRDSVKAALAKK